MGNDVRDGDMNAPIDRMDREWKAMEDPEFIDRVGHELTDEDSHDAQEAAKTTESNSGGRRDSWMKARQDFRKSQRAAESLLEVASDVVRADPVTLLVWLLLFLLTGPIALIIWLAFLVLGRHDLAGI